jgi:hypothetical protein
MCSPKWVNISSGSRRVGEVGTAVASQTCNPDSKRQFWDWGEVKRSLKAEDELE